MTDEDALRHGARLMRDECIRVADLTVIGALDDMPVVGEYVGWVVAAALRRIREDDVVENVGR